VIKKRISNIILIEPRLQSKGDHYLNYAVDFAHAAEKLKLKTIIVTDRNIETDVQKLLEENGIHVIPVFPTRLLTIANIRFINWVMLSFGYAAAVMGLIRKYGKESIVCTISGNLEYLTVIGFLFLMLGDRQPPVVQMYVWESRENRSFTPRLIRIMRRLTEIAIQKAVIQKKIIIAGQGKDVADHIHERIGVEIPELPFIIDWNTFETGQRGEFPYRIGFLGTMRAEKGLRQLVSAIPCVRSEVQLYIQANVPASLGEPDAVLLIEEIKRLKNCRLISGEMDIPQYKKLLSMLDIILLPYRPEDFSHKTSNVFAEAMGLGKIIVAPEDTSIGRKLKEMNTGVVYSPYNKEQLAKAIDFAVLNYESLFRSAQKAASVWRLENSAEAFIQYLLEIRRVRCEFEARS